MTDIRVFFAKKEGAQYISHLDLVRCVSRSLRRSGLPLWYTEGFNPHIYITFALPLSLGYEGERESFDMRLTGEVDLEQVLHSLRHCFPPGLAILEVAHPLYKPEAIAWADYAISLFPQRNDDPQSFQKDWEAFCGLDAIIVDKKGKKGMAQVDIRPHFTLLESGITHQGGTAVTAKVRLAAGQSLNVNPALLLGAFTRETGRVLCHLQISRERILTGEYQPFR